MRIGKNSNTFSYNPSVLSTDNLYEIISCKGFRSLEEFTFPNVINVCVIRGLCPCRCIHCPVGTEYEKRRERFGISHMDLSLFKKIVDEVSLFSHATLRIHGVGEPILWKNLEKALKYLRKRNIFSWIFTCGIGSHKKLKEIVECCSIVEVSVNSFDRGNYYKTKGIDKFGEVFENIRFMRRVIEEGDLKTRLIVTRVDDGNVQYNKRFVKFWKHSGLVDDAFVRSFHNYNGILKTKILKNRKKKENIPCIVHWRRFNIDCDGTVVICFNELFRSKKPNSNIVLGNVKKRSIYSIWHSKLFTLIRVANLTGKYDLLKPYGKCMPCENCEYCQPLTNLLTSENQVKLYKSQFSGVRNENSVC